MKKTVVLINGVSAPIKERNFLSDFLKEIGYEVFRINLVGEEVNLEDKAINRYIRKVVGGRKIDLIIGWSLGGMVAPIVAQNFPEAKVILVASGVGNLNKLKYLEPVVGWGSKALNLPKNWIIKIYGAINPVGDGVKREYQQQMEENINFFQSLGPKRIKEVFDFIAQVDNQEKLKAMSNKTLVLSGAKDRLLPIEEGKKIYKLVKNSQFLITEGGHYDVIGPKQIPVLREFLVE